MPNMGYCMFENTLADLKACRERLREAGEWEELIDDVSEREEYAMREMPKVLAQMLELYDNL